MRLALNQPILEFTNNGLQTWIGRSTHLHNWFDFNLPIKDVLLLSHGNMVIPLKRAIQCLYVFQYPQIMEALLDRCLEQVRPCVTVPRPVFTSWTSDSAYFDRLNPRFEAMEIQG